LDRLGSAQLVTCSALLDLLTIDHLDAIGSDLAVARQPALFSLTVTGARGTVAAPPFDSHLIRAFISQTVSSPVLTKLLTNRFARLRI
jgi:hypothetical protein